MGSSELFCTLYTYLLYTHSLVIGARLCVASEGEVVEKVAYSLILHGTKYLLDKMHSEIQLLLFASEAAPNTTLLEKHAATEIASFKEANVHIISFAQKKKRKKAS